MPQKASGIYYMHYHMHVEQDFTALDTTLSIYSNSRTNCTDIDIIYDYVHENFEEFTVNLAAAPNLTLPSFVTLSPTFATVGIYNRNSK